MKAVIFDLDGVLVTTDDLHYTAWKAIAEEEGIYFDREINHCLRGVSRMDSLDIILKRAAKSYSPKEKSAMAEKKNRIYRNLLENLNREALLPGAVETLQTLRDHGFSIALGSSSKNAKTILEKTCIECFFHAISDGNLITHSKPDPEVFLKAAQLMKVSPEDCIVVEDAAAGIQAAKAAGMLAVAIGDATRCPNADKYISSLWELPNLLIN